MAENTFLLGLFSFSFFIFHNLSLVSSLHHLFHHFQFRGELGRNIGMPGTRGRHLSKGHYPSIYLSIYSSIHLSICLHTYTIYITYMAGGSTLLRTLFWYCADLGLKHLDQCSWFEREKNYESVVSQTIGHGNIFICSVCNRKPIC